MRRKTRVAVCAGHEPRVGKSLVEMLSGQPGLQVLACDACAGRQSRAGARADVTILPLGFPDQADAMRVVRANRLHNRPLIVVSLCDFGAYVDSLGSLADGYVLLDQAFTELPRVIEEVVAADRAARASRQLTLWGPSIFRRRAAGA